MNLQIYKKLCNIIHKSPQAFIYKDELHKIILYEFGVYVPSYRLESNTLENIVNEIEYHIISEYFAHIWQPNLDKFKYSGWNLVPIINQSRPQNVLDVGCGNNEFKEHINNLTGIDPYNDKADHKLHILDYTPDFNYDTIMCLGSINFGSVGKIIDEMRHVTSLLKDFGNLHCRFNPGKSHKHAQSKYIDFFDWNHTFILNLGASLHLEVLILKNDYNDRIYLHAKKKLTL